jgi:hypothetical protein
MQLGGIGWGGMDCIDLADRENWRALMDALMNP